MTKVFLKVIAAALALIAAPAFADDIDIYSAPTSSLGAPNVLLVLDNSANWSQNFGSGTKFTAEKDALRAVVSALTAKFNLGVMLYTESGGGNSGNDGGYVRFAIQPMTNSDGTATNARYCLLKMVGDTSSTASTNCANLSGNTYFTNLDVTGDKSNGGKGGLTMAEAYKYLAGATVYAGNHKVKADYTRALVGGNIGGNTYNKPTVDACAKTYVIFLNNGPFSDNSSDTSSATTLLSGAGGSTAVINPPDNGTSKNNVTDEWARWLYKSSLGAITYTLEVGPATTGQGPYNTQLLQSMGTQGKGGYYSASDTAGLLKALQTIVNDILATNSVFAAASLPLSTDNSGISENQVYMGVFRPDASGRPLWPGNLKQYKFAADLNGNLSLVDSLNALASSSSGFAQTGAVSFWTSKNTSSAPDATFAASTDATNGSTGGFWWKDCKGDGGCYDSPDGQWVEKGGAAQQLRLAYLGYGGKGGIGDANTSTLNSKPARQVYTCTGTCLATSGSALSAYPFDSTNAALTATAFNATSTELPTMLKWFRGQDTADENQFKVNGANTDVRASIHGDVLHSRPVVLDYGTAGTFVFYGGNDGVFRAIKGGQAASDGVEQWAFIPSDFFGTLRRLYDNSPLVKYPSTSTSITPTPTKRNYFFDGPVATYTERSGTNITKAYLFIGMRRGGRMMYALDVTTPTNPKFLWRIRSSDTGFSELGQTWSQPMITKIRGKTNPVLIFGGGYDDASEDVEPPAQSDTTGRAIFMVDAFDGSLVWAAKNGVVAKNGTVSGMDFGIAAEVLAIDRDFDGYADRVYVPDVGGNVWRLDINDASTSNWNVWKIASLSTRAGNVAAKTRKILSGVDVVFGNSYDSVFVGTGDREHPLSTATAQSEINRFYVIKDTATGLTGTNLALQDQCDASISSSCSDFFDATSTGTIPADAKGWSITFATGEKVVNRPVVIGGHALFGTNTPDTTGSTCTANLGIARRYDVELSLTGTSIVVDSSIAPGGGFLPNTVVGVVSVDGKNYLYAIDNPLSPGGGAPHLNVSQRRYRAYWHEVTQ